MSKETDTEAKLPGKIAALEARVSELELFLGMVIPARSFGSIRIEQPGGYKDFSVQLRDGYELRIGVTPEKLREFDRELRIATVNAVREREAAIQRAERERVARETPPPPQRSVMEYAMTPEQRARFEKAQRARFEKTASPLTEDAQDK